MPWLIRSATEREGETVTQPRKRKREDEMKGQENRERDCW